MKKVLSLVLVLMAVMAVSAFAAELPTYVPETDGTYTVGYTGTANNFYALLVVEGVYEETDTPVISEDTVLYIDQATAGTDGTVNFGDWIPKTDEPATVYIGGTGLEKPVLIGYLGQSTFIVKGTVTTDSGTSHEATVTLTDAEGTVFTAVSTSGAYTVEVPEGTYTFVVNVKNHLSYTDADFAVNVDVEGKDVTVKGGDIDASGSVDFTDLLTILDDYEETTGIADIDGDGTADFTDLLVILDNYEEVATVE